ncbi:largest subunit of the RNA polymerase II complex [Sarcoptes scabiei]|nr:largest subunit of the RNA polymerase II complex [Sarcoptes scabiei]
MALNAPQVLILNSSRIKLIWLNSFIFVEREFVTKGEREREREKMRRAKRIILEEGGYIDSITIGILYVKANCWCCCFRCCFKVFHTSRKYSKINYFINLFSTIVMIEFRFFFSRKAFRISFDNSFNIESLRECIVQFDLC